MRFALDAHALGRHLTGNEVYARSLLQSFSALDRESEFIAYVATDDAREWVPRRFEMHRVAADPFRRLGVDLPARLWMDRPDVVHVQYTAPLLCPAPIVVTVHDVSFLEHPEYFTAGRRWQLCWTVRRTVSRAARILTGSEFSRDTIIRAYGERVAEKVVVIPIAAESTFRVISREHAAAKARLLLGIDRPFVLTVGDLQPRKNQIGLIEAFARLLEAHPQLPHHLVLVGQDTWFAHQVHAAARASGVAERIHFTGYIKDEELLTLYSACEVFAFPSFYEGFGLPVLEAMACGRAVACSNATAVPEVADGAAIMFDPGDPDEIGRALSDLLLDAELRARMERLGLQRSAHFSWQATARKTLGVYGEVAARRRAGEAKPASILSR